LIRLPEGGGNSTSEGKRGKGIFALRPEKGDKAGFGIPYRSTPKSLLLTRRGGRRASRLEEEKRERGENRRGESLFYIFYNEKGRGSTCSVR